MQIRNEHHLFLITLRFSNSKMQWQHFLFKTFGGSQMQTCNKSNGFLIFGGSQMRQCNENQWFFNLSRL